MQQGIDVAAKREDIRLIVLRHFSVPGVHPDDLVQEVLLGILQRNQLPGSAWDPERGSFGTYVYLVAKNVAALLARREAHEQRARAYFREHLCTQVSGLNGWAIQASQAGEPICVPADLLDDVGSAAELLEQAEQPRRPRRSRRARRRTSSLG